LSQKRHRRYESHQEIDETFPSDCTTDVIVVFAAYLGSQGTRCVHCTMGCPKVPNTDVKVAATLSTLGLVRISLSICSLRTEPPPSDWALASEAFIEAQSAHNTSAGVALTQMGARLAAKTGPLAERVRLRQDLGAR